MPSGYRLQQGSGPREGWVTVKLAGGKAQSDGSNEVVNSSFVHGFFVELSRKDEWRAYLHIQ